MNFKKKKVKKKELNICKNEKKIYRWVTYYDETLNYLKDNNIKNDLQNLFYFSKDISKTQQKKYGVSTYDEFFEVFQKVNKNHRRYHEMLLNDKFIKLFLDIESPLKNNEHLKNSDFICEHIHCGFVKFISTLLNENCGLDIDYEKDFIYLTASSDKKLSYHVHYIKDDILFENKEQLYNFINYALSIYDEASSLIITKESKNGDLYKISIIDIGAAKGTSFRIYDSIKMGDIGNECRRLHLYDVNKKTISYEFDLSILKKTLVHYIEIYEGESIVISCHENDDNNSIILYDTVVNNDNDVDIKEIKKKDRFNRINTNSFSMYISRLIDDLLDTYSNKFNIQIDNNYKINATKISEEGKAIIIQLKHKCIISKCLGEKEHENDSGYSILISLDKKYILPNCFHDSCRQIKELIKEKMRTTISAYNIELLKIVFDKKKSYSEKIKSIDDHERFGKELEINLNQISIMNDDLFN